jgi:hypothetical protein
MKSGVLIQLLRTWRRLTAKYWKSEAKSLHTEE